MLWKEISLSGRAENCLFQWPLLCVEDTQDEVMGLFLKRLRGPCCSLYKMNCDLGTGWEVRDAGLVVLQLLFP